MRWTESTLARALVNGPLKGKKLIIVPNCNWTGYECDLLVIDEKLRIVDIEVKISRADFKADAKKDKWVRRASWQDVLKRCEHPHLVYKHYYALPASIWKNDMAQHAASEKSGIILLYEPRFRMAHGMASLHRRAQPNPAAKPISANAAVDIARLASFRAWDAMEKLAALVPVERRTFNG